MSTTELTSLRISPQDGDFKSLKTLNDELVSPSPAFELSPFLTSITIDYRAAQPPAASTNGGGGDGDGSGSGGQQKSDSNDTDDFAGQLSTLFTTLSEDHGVMSIDAVHISPPAAAAEDHNPAILAALHDTPALRPRFADIRSFVYQALHVQADTLRKVAPAATVVRVWWREEEMEERGRELEGVLRDGGLMMMERIEVVVVGKEEGRKRAEEWVAGLVSRMKGFPGRERFGAEVVGVEGKGEGW